MVIFLGHLGHFFDQCRYVLSINCHVLFRFLSFVNSAPFRL